MIKALWHCLADLWHRLQEPDRINPIHCEGEGEW